MTYDARRPSETRTFEELGIDLDGLQQFAEETLLEDGVVPQIVMVEHTDRDDVLHAMIMLPGHDGHEREPMYLAALIVAAIQGTHVIHLADSFYLPTETEEEARTVGPLKDNPHARDAISIAAFKADDQLQVLLPYHREDGTGKIVWEERTSPTSDFDSWIAETIHDAIARPMDQPVAKIHELVKMLVDKAGFEIAIGFNPDVINPEELS